MENDVIMCVSIDEKEDIRAENDKTRADIMSLAECAEVILRCLKKTIIDKRKEEENDNNSTSN
jgi:hypothetical protein